MKYLFQIAVSVVISLAVSISGVYALTKLPPKSYDNPVKKVKRLENKRTSVFLPVKVNEYYSLGASYLANGEYAKAIDNFNKVLELDESYTLAYLKLARAYEKSGNYTLAKKYYHYYLKLNPEDKKVYLALYEIKKLQGW